jgi:hypothetical protein
MLCTGRGDMEVILNALLELIGGTAELGHELTELTGELGHVLRTEENHGEDKDKSAITEARHM